MACVTQGSLLCRIRGHTAAEGPGSPGSGADLHLRPGPRLLSAFPGLRKDTGGRPKTTGILHCFWGQSLLIGKAKLPLRQRFFRKETRCNWLKAITLMLKLDGRARSLLLVTSANNAMERRVTKHKNSLEPPGRPPTPDRCGRRWPPRRWREVRSRSRREGGT